MGAEPTGIDRLVVLGQVALGSLLAVTVLRSAAAPLSIAGAILVAALAAGLALAAFVALRPSFRIAPTPRRDARLIAHGIYRWLRHPMYTAVVLILVAAFLLRPDPWVGAASAANLAFYLTKARYEEGLLLARYPDYAAYRRRTLGVIPGW